MKRAIIVCMLLLAGVAAAHADYYEQTYHDIVRPHGKPQSDAIYQANLDICYAQTHEDRTRFDTPAFKQCMLVHGYRYQSTRVVKTTPIQQAHTGPGVTVSIGGGGNRSIDDAAAADEAALAASQAATQITNDGIAQTVQGINGP
jgi:hypothetical protein